MELTESRDSRWGLSVLKSTLNPLQVRLIEHPIYGTVSSPLALRHFMASHVFAVWDFMVLLKSLQERLTGRYPVWLPPRDALAARLINEIVLTEESDEISPGTFKSHFEIYLGAMTEIGADRGPIDGFLQRLRAGVSVEGALLEASVDEAVSAFVLSTVTTAKASPHEAAAAFLFGREDIIPKMFLRLLPAVESFAGVPCHAFRFYLRRHIEIDANSHAPMAEHLLLELCADIPSRWQEARHAAETALQQRLALWDAIERQVTLAN